VTALEIRLIGYGVAAGLLLWLLLAVKGWHDDAVKLPQVQQDFAVYKTAVEEGAKVRKEVSDGFENEKAGLQARIDAAGPARAVRLCAPASPSVVPGATGGPVRDPGPATGAGVLPQEPGPDIGQRLYGDADKADVLSAQLRACQAYAAKVQAWGISLGR